MVSLNRTGRSVTTFGSLAVGIRNRSTTEEVAQWRQAEIWIFTETRWTQNDLTGFAVEALDGSIGKVDEASNDVSSSYIVVDTGSWIFGKKVMLPAGVIRDVDLDSETVFVNRTKDEIKNAPEYDDRQANFDDYRNRLGGYYGPRRGGLPRPLAHRARPSRRGRKENREKAFTAFPRQPSSSTRRAAPCPVLFSQILVAARRAATAASVLRPPENPIQRSLRRTPP